MARKRNQMRKIEIVRDFTKYAAGSVLIKWGDTWVLCTASVSDKVPSFLRDTAREGVQDLLDVCFGVDNLDGATKLSRGYDLTAHLKATGLLAPNQSVFFIGDTLHDAEVGAALGATPILVEGGHQNGDRLRASGHTVVPSLLAAVQAAAP